MIAFVFLGLVVVFVMWRVGRRRRRMVEAGLTGARPVFSVEPPSRVLGNRRNERL